MGESKGDGRDPKAGDRQQQGAPRPAHGAAMGQCHGHDDGADRGGRPKPAESDRTDLKDLFGKDGQKRRRPAEKDGEEIEG